MKRRENENQRRLREILRVMDSLEDAVAQEKLISFGEGLAAMQHVRRGR